MENLTTDEVKSCLILLSGERHEMCGLIAVNDWGYTLYPIRNIHDAPLHNYLMDVLDQRLAYDDMSREGKTLWGAYHTHPNSGSDPSPGDMENWKYPKHLKMVIANSEEVTVWEFDGEALQQVIW